MGLFDKPFDKPLFPKVGTHPDFLKSTTLIIGFLFTSKLVVFQLLIHYFKDEPKKGLEPSTCSLRMKIKNIP